MVTDDHDQHVQTFDPPVGDADWDLGAALVIFDSGDDVIESAPFDPRVFGGMFVF